ncbi:hypothetical protein RE6C_02067 [Rhodopirellula europaea 6C]|uniref:Uncharacterized protein n=1 Tax=Rhodopirellula europaea 6C TaxID=1263867 RepID=M2B4P9_9BACT|nr:hypothetical protein RE6C_02067 [Rhodopirellula europaea 6C]
MGMRLNDWRQSLTEVIAVPMASGVFRDRGATSCCKGGIGRGERKSASKLSV